MIYAGCSKCSGDIEKQEKVIDAIDPGDNYTIIKARLHECIDCGHRMYVKE